MQMEFTQALLKACGEEGIHTCVETSGFGNSEKLLELDAYVDLYLFDYKLSNEADHIKYTGVGNGLILKNLDMLMKNGAKAIMRCPIIPTVNDHLEHFGQIAGIAKKYPGIIAVELMAYHKLGLSKAIKVGDAIAFDTDIETVEEEQKKIWQKTVRSFGYPNVRIG
ncbi:MAG: radical SAM protein [Proteobacteria bacterium]|nr:radical SAM protein [Pseudomonadota bacterium]